MNNILIWLIIVLSSLLFGALHFMAQYVAEIKARNNYYKFLEFWREAINYFIAGVIAYYFVSVRWAYISQGKSLSAGDFVLGIVFLTGAMGWLPYLVKNVTEAIAVIFQKFLSK